MRELRHAEIVLIRGDGNAKIAACGNRVGARMRQHGDSGGRWQAKNKKRAAAKLRQLRELIYDQADSRACAAQRSVDAHELNLGLKLLKLNLSACLFELLLDLLSVLLGSALLDILGSALNEVLSLLKAETGDLTNSLDNVELLSAEGLKNYVEFCLFFCCGSRCRII